MAELVKIIVDLLIMLWPVRIVWAWQRGVYFVGGRAVGVVGPGIKFVVPYLCDVRMVVVVPEVHLTPLHTVTLRDGSVLAYSASITVVVRDAHAAYCTLGHWSETVVEIAAAVMSEGLADAEVSRFDPQRGKRDRLVEELREAVNAQLATYGLEATALRMSNFIRGVRTMRLLLDHAVLQHQPVR